MGPQSQIQYCTEIAVPYQDRQRQMVLFILFMFECFFLNHFIVFPDAGQGSPATLTGPPGSNTPQYTASPAPSGSSTPGPAPPQGANFPGAPPNSTTPQYNGPNQSGPFGSPGKVIFETYYFEFGWNNSQLLHCSVCEKIMDKIGKISSKSVN